MNARTTVLKPGFLVALRSSVRGGVSYSRVELENETSDEGSRARWETTREIPDPEAHEAAKLARRKATSAIWDVCCKSTFGLLCPVDKEDALRAGIDEAHRIAAAHNAASAGKTWVDVHVFIGRIAQDDVEAARAISAEVRGLIDEMKAGIAAADPQRIRDAATKARELGGMLNPDAADKVSAAIEEARKAAREIVRRVEKSGEQAAAVVAEVKTTFLNAARFSFLDMDPAPVAAAPTQITAPAMEV